MKFSNKLVSVIMPVFNPRKTQFELAVKSILNQTYRNIELIIINDGSNNGFDFNSISNLDERIRVIGLKTNHGISFAINLGIKHANGSYIARMDADDISFLNRIENQIKM